MKMYVTWDDLQKHLQEITRQISVSQWKPEVILAPSRGGLSVGVMLSHYFEVAFFPFVLQTRDGNVEDLSVLEDLLSKYKDKNVLIIDDINDTGKTLEKIHNTVKKCLHKDVRYATIFEKMSSKFGNVNYTARELGHDQDFWIVFPYEEWWR